MRCGVDQPEKIPPNGPVEALPDPATEDKPKTVTDRASFWWIVSIAAHAVLILVIIFVPPVRDALFGRAKAEDEITLNAARIRQISEEMRDSARAAHFRQMAKMRDVHDRLVQIRDRQFSFVEERPENNQVVRVAKAPPADDRSAEVPISRLYQQMLDMEQVVADTYQEIRTAKLARIQNISMEDAIEATKVPVPPRAAVNADHLDAVVDTTRNNKLEHFRQALRVVADEENSIVLYAQNLQKLADQMERAEIDGINVDLAAAAEADPGTNPGAVLAPWEITRSHEAKEGTIKALPGRKLVEKGTGGEWMYIDTWYIIGPFENPNRASLNKAFLPESLVDLDAEYTGKNDQKITWKYWRVNKPRINPPKPGSYEVYYGYTELYCDKERAVWVALGSDDQGKLWINEELVWVSPSEPKAFKEDEQFQLVKLRQGVNRLLFRLENAGGLMGFSMMINTMPME